MTVVHNDKHTRVSSSFWWQFV